MGAPILVWTGTAWKRRGSSGGGGTPPVTPRSQLIPGTYKPDDTTTGLLPDVTRTNHMGNITAVAGQVIQNLNIFGTIGVSVPGVRVRNCWVRGQQSNSVRTASDSSKGLITCTNVNASDLVVEDCLLKPDYPSNVYNGILGHDCTVRRTRFIHCSDAIGWQNTARPGEPINGVVEGCFMDKFFFTAPSDTGAREEGTHNDGMQMLGGSNWVIRGNRIHCIYDMDPNLPYSMAHIKGEVGTRPAGATSDSINNIGYVPGNKYYPAATGTGCVTITPTATVTGNIQVHDVIIDKNWLYGGGLSIIIVENGFGTITGLEITDNKFGHDQRQNGAGFPLNTVGSIDPNTSLAAATIRGNVFEDGVGTPIIG